MNRLSLRGVTKRFSGESGDVVALDRISLDVARGEFVTLVGPSGCGKSTLLSVVAGLETADAGEVRMDGRPVTCAGRERSMVFQDGALFPWLDALGNVEFGLKRMGLPRAERRTRALGCLDLVQLGAFRDAFPHELSGGMRQRVAIARALAVEPEVLLMDEPFSALDAITREELYAELQRIWERLGTTILFVTHNVREAVTLGDRVVLLAACPGRVQAEFAVRLARPREIDDPDVARMAKGISLAMKHGDPRLIPQSSMSSCPVVYRGQDGEPREALGVLRGPDRAVGGGGEAGAVG